MTHRHMNTQTHLGIRTGYELGMLTRETLKDALMHFDRFAKRVAERGLE